MQNLVVTIVQTSLVWENPAANLSMLSKKIESIGYTHLIILPETFSTGFSMNPEFAEPMDGSAVNWMKQTAAQKQCVVCGSLMIVDKGSYYNRLIWMQPDGAFFTYDKRHLFCISNEPKFFTAGTERLIVTLNGWKICPQICYDLRFPVWARNKNETYDVLLYTANWPERRQTAWLTLLPARAIENQCYVVGVNRVGDDGKGIAHTGNSMVIDALGGVLYNKQNMEDIATLELEHAPLLQLREQLPFLQDADDFILNPKQKIKSH